jgi:hypothetical protein
MGEYIRVYKLHIEFESEHDWNEMREVMERWEIGGAAQIDEAHNIQKIWDGADSPFSTKEISQLEYSYIDSRRDT